MSSVYCWKTSHFRAEVPCPLSHNWDMQVTWDFPPSLAIFRALVVQNHTVPSLQGSPSYCPYYCPGKKGGHPLEMSLVNETDI